MAIRHPKNQDLKHVLSLLGEGETAPYAAARRILRTCSAQARSLLVGKPGSGFAANQRPASALFMSAAGVAANRSAQSWGSTLRLRVRSPLLVRGSLSSPTWMRVEAVVARPSAKVGAPCSFTPNRSGMDSPTV
jgi:hypothetical protein